MFLRINYICLIFLFVSFTKGNDYCYKKTEKYPIVSINSDKQLENIEKVLHKVNKGLSIVSNICEDLESKGGFFTKKKDKPSCDLDITYVDRNEIVISKISSDFLSFLKEMKNQYCKSGEIECGEIMVGIKIAKLINNVVKITTVTSDFTSIIINLSLIDYDDTFDNYLNIINSNELLSNLVLKNDRFNNFIEKQKIIMKREKNKQWYDEWSHTVDNVVGTPLKTVINWTGSTLGQGVGSIFSGFSHNILESVYGVLIILIIIIILKLF